VLQTIPRDRCKISDYTLFDDPVWSSLEPVPDISVDRVCLVGMLLCVKSFD